MIDAEQPAARHAQRARSFDRVAEAYEMYRPSYPDELVEHIVRQAGLQPGDRILEIGCGTGKASELFARRSYGLLCVEPGRNLAAVAAAKLAGYGNVRFADSAFEDWREQPAAFPLAISAQAWHWVPAEIGYAKVARALRPGGYLALFWNRSRCAADPLRTELDVAYHELAPELVDPLATSAEAPMSREDEEIAVAIAASGWFGPVTVSSFPWVGRYDTEHYLGLLDTYSDHIMLAEEKRRRLYSAIGGILERHGGFVDKPYVAMLHMAQKVTEPG